MLLAACNPTYNWRDYASPDAQYRVTFPAKPLSTTRSIDLDGMRVDMTMTAAEVDGATFAVGAATAPDAAHARAALDAMRRALLRNIGASAGTSKERTATASDAAGGSGRAAIDVDASGTRGERTLHLAGHFEARDTRFYQVIVLATDKPVPPEQIEQFLTSFSLP